MEEAPENSKESSHSAHANGMNEYIYRDSVRITTHLKSYGLVWNLCNSTLSSLQCIAENLNVSKNGAFLFLVDVTVCVVMSHCVTTVVLPVLSPGNLWLPRSCVSTGS